jgi:hypothetical protein
MDILRWDALRRHFCLRAARGRSRRPTADPLAHIEQGVRTVMHARNNGVP